MPYRFAILSDIHADMHALEDALRIIDTLNCSSILCAGDIVDYGLFPDETIALLAERHIPCIRGNHDRWAIGSAGLDLSRDSKRFLARLPIRWSTVVDGTRIAMHHASPRGDMDGIDPDSLTSDQTRELLDEADADILMVGHTHKGFCIKEPSGRMIVNPAALLRAPAEGAENPPATASFGILDLPSRRFQIYGI